jgi:hypothetical protein
MKSRELRTLTSIFLTSILTLACNGGGGTTDASTTDASTSDATTGTTGSTTDATTGTTGEPTTTPTTSGNSDSMTGSSTGDSTGSTGPVVTTGDDTTGSTGDATTGSTGDATTGSTGGTTGDTAIPVSFAECQGGDADQCPAEDPACLVVDGPGGFRPNGSFFVTWSYCTRECDEDADCVSGPQGGTAKARCLPKGANDIKVCVLDCSFGKTCPEGLQCSNDDACGTKFCDCQGSGCDDILCKE